MQITDTDLKLILRLLTKSAALIDKYCPKPHEQDTARQCRRAIKTLTGKKKRQG